MKKAARCIYLQEKLLPQKNCRLKMLFFFRYLTKKDVDFFQKHIDFFFKKLNILKLKLELVWTWNCEMFFGAHTPQKCDFFLFQFFYFYMQKLFIYEGTFGNKGFDNKDQHL